MVTAELFQILAPESPIKKVLQVSGYRDPMSSCLGRFKHSEKEPEKTAFMMRNGEILLKRLIVSFNGRRNPVRSFTAEDLKIATNNYDTQKVKTNKYMFGYNLYKGFLQERQISVMKFYPSISDASENCFNSIVFASQMSHKSILKLVGCCLESTIPTLVFESVEYGTLHDRLYGLYQPHFKPLLLTHRLKIATELANAVSYLHLGFSRPIVYRNVFHPSNILFHEQYVAKLFDFSVAKSIPKGETHIEDVEMQRVVGVAAPKCLTTGHCNEKCDVYSFALLLLELLIGRKIYDLVYLSREDDCAIADYFKKYINNNRFIEIVDPVIIQDRSYPEKEQQLLAFWHLILECTNESAEDRPTMIYVAKQLRQMYRSVV